jgi:mRNA-degrading endonuclease RelE of RelBE toxin-antitoxin system
MAKPPSFSIGFTEEALEDMQEIRKFDQQRIIGEIEARLTYQPLVETRNRKPLEPNPLAAWELRADPYRIFYDVDTVAVRVSIIAVGRKVGGRLFVRGEELEL